MATNKDLILTVRREGDDALITITDDDEFEFADFMLATEWLMHHTAKLSGAGFERALELLADGAMTYRRQGA